MLIAIYGGVGSGKSYAASYLKDTYGAYILEADSIAHRLYEKNQPGYKAVVKICGRSILDLAANIDRAKLGDLLYANPKLRAKVNKAIHPMVFKECRRITDKLYRENPEYVIMYESALPSHHYAAFDSVWYIKTPAEKSFKLLEETRGYSRARFDEIKNNQPADEYFEKLADLIIVNDGTLKELETKLDEAFEYCKRKLR